MQIRRRIVGGLGCILGNLFMFAWNALFLGLMLVDTIRGPKHWAWGFRAHAKFVLNYALQSTWEALLGVAAIFSLRARDHWTTLLDRS